MQMYCALHMIYHTISRKNNKTVHAHISNILKQRSNSAYQHIERYNQLKLQFAYVYTNINFFLSMALNEGLYFNEIYI